MMRGVVLVFCAAMTAGPVAAQSFDSEAEAWSVAARNSVTPDGWRMMNVDSTSAAFLSVSGSAESGRWVAMLDAEAMQIEFGLAQSDCKNGRWRWKQSSTRDWLGNHVGDAGTTEFVAPTPGSVGEIIFIAICPNHARVVSVIPPGRIDGPTIPVPPLPSR